MFFKHALGHNWKDNGDETATCTRNGCGKKHTHEWDSGTITTEPTCTAPGEKHIIVPMKKMEFVKLQKQKL